jgi:hypothetical protein
MLFRALALSAGIAALMLFAACGSDRTYSASKGDDDYNLAAMALTQADMPAGLEEVELPDHVFDNESWAGLFGADDPAAKQKAYESQGRLKTYLALFQAQQFGRILSVTSYSTLYTDVNAAIEAQSKWDCGIPLNDGVVPSPFTPVQIGDKSTGFITASYNTNADDPSQNFGGQFSDANLCFRTGRILHVVQQSSVPGVEDLALLTQLGDRMLGHVNDAFDGKTPVPTTPPAETATQPASGTQPAGTAPAGSSPAAATTPAASPTK